MKHTHVERDFSVDIVPISTGELERLLRMNDCHVGLLREFLCDLLFDIPGVFASKFWFTLVNVTCTHSGVSYGLGEPPPEKVRPLSATYLFTFDLKGAGYLEDSVPSTIVKRGLETTVWGYRSNQFVTISITHRQATDWKLGYGIFAPQILYHLLGPLTKGYVLNRRTAYADNYEQFYQSWDQSTLKSKWLMTPLYTLLRYADYPKFVFNRNVWALANCMLSPKHINTDSLLYVCKNIRYITKLPEVIEDLVVDKFQESLASYIHRYENQEPATESWQFLYPALVHRGEDFDPNAFTTPIPTANHATHILGLLYA